MNWKLFFKPDALKVIIAITISGFLTMILFLLNTPFIPCSTMPQVSPELNDTFQPSLCSISIPVGVTIEFDWLSYLVLITTFGLIPYLIACLIYKSLSI